MTTARKIITRYVHPPIPVRWYDWSAHFEGEKETGRAGWGENEEAAIKDLRRRYDD